MKRTPRKHKCSVTDIVWKGFRIFVEKEYRAFRYGRCEKCHRNVTMLFEATEYPTLMDAEGNKYL